MDLRKIVGTITTDYNKIMGADYNEDQWNKEGRKVMQNIKKFETSIKDLEIMLNKSDIDHYRENQTLTQKITKDTAMVKDYVAKTKRTIAPNVSSIVNKTRIFKNRFEDFDSAAPPEANNEVGEGQLSVQDLSNNQEFLQKRREELEAIHKVAANLKDMTDQMAVDLEAQGEVLDQIEENVDKGQVNVEKGKQEIMKADETSRGNRKRMLCLIFIVLIAILGITGILLSVIFNN